MSTLSEEINRGNPKKVVIAGHFNPLHVGHLQLIDGARRLGKVLTVIVANDEQARMKREPVLLPLQDRMMIMSHIKGVDKVIASIDTDSSVKETLKLIRPDILASGCSPDHPDAVEEAGICDSLGIRTVWGVGGDKIKSSSEILKQYEEKRL